MESKWFPATKLSMGSWEYFSLKMSFADFFSNEEGVKDLISFNKEFGKADLLDNVMQRLLDESRSKFNIAEYLCEKDDAFFNSIVIACLGDVPEWEHVPIDEEKRKKLKIEKREHLGYVKLDTSQSYYVLDGQHRLFAIKYILQEPDFEKKREKAEKKGEDLVKLIDRFGGMSAFEDTSINVILVSKGDIEEEESFRPKYRRLFTALNRYAKSTSEETNVIMDEDDTAAILTRRLIKDLPIFQAQEKPEDNPHILTSSRSLPAGSEKSYYFTSLVTFYHMNITLLQTRRNTTQIKELKQYKKYKTERPSEELLDSLYEPLKKQWEAIIKLFPIFSDIEFRKLSRDGNATLSSNRNDHLFLRPAGQTDILAPLMQMLIDNADSDDEDFEEILRPIAVQGFDWDLRRPPFKHLILVNEKVPQKNEYTWKISTSAVGDEKRMDLAKRLAYWLVKDDVSKRRVNDLKKDVLPSLTYRGTSLSKQDKQDWWDEVCNIIDYSE